MEKKAPAPFLGALEEGICAFFLACLTLLPAGEALLRVAFHSRIPSSPALTLQILLCLGLLSGMITTRAGDHLSIGLSQYGANEGLKRRFAVLSGLLSAFVTAIFAWCSVSFIKIYLSPPQIIGFIPDQAFALVMPAGYAVMAFRFARLTPLRGKARLLPALAVLLGSAWSLPVIFKVRWGFDLPEAALRISGGCAALAAALKVPALIGLILAALAGTPLFVVIGGAALILIQGAGGEMDVVANQIYTALTQNSYVAIPLFTLAGFFLSESKAGERLLAAFKGLFGWFPGGVIIAAVVMCAFFTSFTGASGVTILALGGILYRVLSDNAGYPSKFSVGLLTASGSIGLLFPPSLPLILVGTATMTNTIHLFLGGIIPGFLLVSGTILLGLLMSRKTTIPREPFQAKKAAAALKQSLPELLLPLLLITGYFSGVLSLVELGAAAVIYVFVVEVLIFRDIRPPEIRRVCAQALPIIGGVLSILALSQALSYYIVDTQGPERFVRWIHGAVSSKYLFLLILNLSLLAIGCLIDIFSAILIVLPLVFPLGIAYGIDPVHLGIIFLINMEAGFLTPPVGMSLFLSAALIRWYR
ncbi:MAG: TRAP transporter large permease subunit [Spirochaetaceae bacterium]|jgi:tripartite ATP-independent transporter DctM subunit|nr:TRAP transporter large permease subunit [Spirochaetaceae bacterium]